jgi:F-type H+-transporting ATPase subunit b
MKKPATLLLAATIVCAASAARARVQEAQPVTAEHAAGAAPEQSNEEEGGMEGWKWANFAVLAAGLGYLISKNAGPFFAARSQKIHQEMTEAQALRLEAEERASAVDRRLASLETEIAELRRQSKAEADSEAARMAQHTTQEIAKIGAHAETEIVAAGKAARMELRRYSAHLAVTLAEQKVRARMDPGTQGALVEGFVHDLANPSARAQSL